MPQTKRSTRHHGLATLAALAGGAGALVNEILWQRELSLSIGSTAPAVALVIAVFFGGLAFGAAFARGAGSRPGASRKLYIACETLLGFLSLCIPLAIRAAGDSGLPSWAPLLFILFPTLAMGATLPLLVAAGGANRSRASQLYAWNTLGGAAGAGVAGFLLLEWVGGPATRAVACGLHAAAALLGTRVAPGAGGAVQEESDGADPVLQYKQSGDGRVRLVALTALLTGAIAILGEVILSRLIYQTLGGTTYAVTATLVIYLLGIVAGAGMASRARNPAAWLPPALAVLAISTAGSFRLLDGLTDSMKFATGPEITPGAAFARSAVIVISVLGPLALASGFVFPLLVRSRAGAPAGALAVVYSVNTVGGIAASLAAGFLLVPAFGTTTCLAWAAIAGAALAIFHAPGRARIIYVILLLALAGLEWSSPGRPERFRFWLYDSLQTQMDIEQGPGREAAPSRPVEKTRLHFEGVAATASVYERTERGRQTLDFAINGKKEASTDFDALRNQYVLGHLPVLLHPAPRSALVVGLGAGVTAGAVSIHEGLQVTIAELSGEVMRATKEFESWNHGVLNRSNVNIIIEDGRRVLARHAREVEAGRAKPFDVITSDPIHPWVSGAANLYSFDYFMLVRRSMAQNGVAAHWLPLYEMRVADAISIYNSFRAAFPSTALWITFAGDAVLIGSPERLKVSLEDFARRGRAAGVADDLQSVKLADPLRFLAGLAVGGELPPFPGAEIITDDHQFLEFRAARNIYVSHTVSENMNYFSDHAWDAAKLVSFIHATGPAVPRLVQLLNANIAEVRVRGRFDAGGPELKSAVLKLWALQPDGEFPVRLLDAPHAGDMFQKPVSAGETFVAVTHDLWRVRGAAKRPRILLQSIDALKSILADPAGDRSYDAPCRRQLAKCLGELRRYDEALDVLDPLLKNNPDPSALRLAALLSSRSGDPARSSQFLQNATKLDLGAGRSE